MWDLTLLSRTWPDPGWLFAAWLRTPATTEQTHTISRDMNTGEVETSWPEGLKNAGVLGKLKLKLRIGRDGRVTEVLVPKTKKN